jgi:ribosomal protein L11 methyltransferase
VVVKSVKYEDWAESWKHHFKPLRFGKSLLVKPDWSKVQGAMGEVVILNPGLAFGTGQHATTKFCLQQIVRYRPRNCAKAFLDVGTGSGILAISASKLGYAPVVAFDYDEEAIKVAAENCGKNGVLNQIKLSKKDVLNSENQRKIRFICAILTPISVKYIIS